jgi:hypothetical protein
VLDGADDSTVDVDAGAGNAIEGLSVALNNNEVGANGAVTVTGGTAVETVTVTGSQDGTLAFTDDNAALATFDATGASGAVDADLTGATTDLTVTFGDGDDTLRLDDATLDDDDSIDMGEGADTVRVTLNANVVAGTNGLGLTNVETVQFDDADASNSIDLDNVTGLTSIAVSESDDDDQTITVDNLVQTASTITFAGDGEDALQEFDGVDVTYDGTDALSSVTVDVSNGGTEAQSVDIGGVTAANVEGINITAADVGTATGEDLSLGTVTGADITSVTASANGDVEATVTGTGELETVDFSEVEGDSNVTLNTIEADGTATFGTGNDQINLVDVTNAGVEITGGAGSDTFTLDGAGGTTTESVITDFVAGNGGDIIDFDTNGSTGPATGFEEIDTGTLAADSGMVVYSGNDLASADGDGIEDLFDDTTSDLQMESDDDDFYLAASDGNDTFVFFVEGTGTNAEFTAAEDTATLLVTLTGVDDATSLNAANFADFLA